MAKKTTKSTRRTRSKKEQTTKKKTSVTKKAHVVPETSLIAEDSREPVAKKPLGKASSKVAATEADKAPPTKPETVTNVSEKVAEAQNVVEEEILPNRNRMLASAFALTVIVIALIFGASIMRQQNEQAQVEKVQTQSSAAADEILRSGGKMCTNQQAASDSKGSTNPQSVGMILQTNPSNDIQTPQTLGGGGSDAAALQGAACF